MAITFSTVLVLIFGTIPPTGYTLDQYLQIMALIIGVALGGNLIPPAATQLLKTIEIAEENYVKGFTFRYFTKYTLLFSTSSIVLGLGYLFGIKLIF
jgi:Na+/H+ antiporter NhaD/arsenite permease-like protein